MTHEIVLELPEEEAMDLSPEVEVESEVDMEPAAFVITDIPGAPAGTQDLVLQVETPEKDEQKVSDSETKAEPKGPWDWKATFPMGFIDWIKDRYAKMPKHTGYDVGGLERAVSYLQHLDAEIGKAIRGDIDGHLDAKEVDEIRSQVEKGCNMIEKRLENVKNARKNNKTASFEDIIEIVKQAEADQDAGIVKEARGFTMHSGIQVTVSLFISTLARMCINGSVSAGHDIEDLFEKACEKFKLEEREKYELRQLISDMNYPIRFDRMSLVGEEVDESSSDNGDWMANYGGPNK